MRVKIDRRPFWLLLLLRGIRPLFLLIIAIIFWYIISITPPEGLSSSGQNALAVFFVCLLFWVTNLIPLAVTSIFAIIMVPFLGILTNRETYALFGNEAVFFILGAFILAGAVMHSGLSRRIALLMMDRFGGTPRGLVSAIFLIAAILSFFMSEHAVAAMLFPIVLEIAKGLKLRPGVSAYGRSLFISLAWGCIIGGVATFLGGARVPLAVGILSETGGGSIGFMDYTIAVFPVIVVMLIVAYIILVKSIARDFPEEANAGNVVGRRLKELGKVSYNEYVVGIIMISTVLAWIILGKRLGLASIALTSVVVLFLLRLVRWKDIEEYVNWGIILMYGGAIILGKALDKSGAASWMAERTIGALSVSPWVIISLLSLATLILTEGMSNAAVIAILMPVGMGLANRFGIDPVIVTLSIAVPAGLAFCLPMSTPANAISVSSNYVGIRDMARVGVFMGLISWVVFNIVVWLYWPIIGMVL